MDLSKDEKIIRALVRIAQTSKWSRTMLKDDLSVSKNRLEKRIREADRRQKGVSHPPKGARGSKHHQEKEKERPNPGEPSKIVTLTKLSEASKSWDLLKIKRLKSTWAPNFRCQPIQLAAAIQLAIIYSARQNNSARRSYSTQWVHSACWLFSSSIKEKCKAHPSDEIIK